MFAGHAAVAFAVKPKFPRLSLGILFAAAFFLDLIWPVFLLLGIERVRFEPGVTAFTPIAFVHYPWSHSLLMVVCWSVLFALVAVPRRLRTKATLLTVGMVVLSHWVLDFVTHRPDLPIVPWSDFKTGLGLWSSISATYIVEGSLFVFAVILYLRSTRAVNVIGSFAIGSLVLFIGIIWIMQPFSPPPPSVKVLGAVGLLSWLLPLWAHAADKNRVSREP